MRPARGRRRRLRQAGATAFAAHGRRRPARQDFVVYVDEPLANVTPAETKPVAITTQKNALFDPHVLPVAVGTTVKWPNEDDIYHNVFSMSDPKIFKPPGLYHQERVPLITFDKVGRVDVFCAIHAQMHCVILVVPNPLFAKVDAHQTFTIKDVPAGTYKLRPGR